MSMHLVGPYLTTTSYKKRKEKITKAKQEELERDWRDRNQRLKQMGLPKETFEQFLEWVHGRGKKSKKKEIYTSKPSPANAEACIGVQEVKPNISKPPDWVTGACAKKPPQVYTGTKIIGIATMHKSNMVPVFSDEEAIEISKMRRG